MWRTEIKRFCGSCDTCQRTLPTWRVSKVPPAKMPLIIIDVAFKKMAVDIVGFLHPPTDKGNIFIFTPVNYASRYPEAITLPGIERERVAEALVEIFSA